MVTKLLLTVPFLVILPALLFGQDNITTLPYRGNMQLVNLNHSGIILSNAGAEEVIVSRIDEEGGLLWETMIPITFTTNKMNRLLFGNRNTQNTHFLVASPSGNNIFLIEASADLFSNSSAVKVTHFDEFGKTRTMEFENFRHEMGSSFHATFCDDRYLYFLAKGKEKRDPVRNREDTFFLNRFDIQSFEYRKISLDLPETYEDKYAESNWVFLGQFKNEKYLVNKFASTKENEVMAKVIAIDDNGNRVRDLELNYSPKNGFIRPFHQVKFRDKNFSLHEMPDYYISKGGPFSSPYRNFKIGAYMDLLLDEDSGDFFLSGLMGDKSFGKDPLHYKNQKYNGFYISKFDEGGNLKWETYRKGADKILTSREFENSYPPGHKNAALRQNSDLGFINFTLQVNELLYNYVIDDSGKIVAVKEKQDYTNATDHMVFLPEEFSNVPAYLESKELRDKDLMFASLSGNRGEFLMQVDQQQRELKIFFFKYDAFHPRLHRELVEK